MTPVPERVQVAIVGAGPAGATLAQILASRGIEVALIERQNDFAREFRGEIVQPSGREVLAQLGIDDVLSAVPTKAPEGLIAAFDKREFANFTVDSALFGDLPPVAISQPALLEALVEAAGRHPTFHFLRGTSVGDLLIEDDRVVGVVASCDGETQSLRADLVVGTDGRSSLVRRRGGFTVHSEELPMDVVWCKLPPLPQDHGRAMVRVWAGAGHLWIGYTSHDDSMQVAWVLFKSGYSELRRRGIAEWVEEMANWVGPDVAAHLRTHRDAVRHPFLLATAADRVAHWWRPGALVLGDAAHTMSPVGGQGINIALRDTIAAANQLVPVLRMGDDPVAIDGACRAVEAARVPEVRLVQRMQAVPPRVIFGEAAPARALRRAVPWLLQRRLVQSIALRGAGLFLRGAEPIRLDV